MIHQFQKVARQLLSDVRGEKKIYKTQSSYTEEVSGKGVPD